MTQGIENLGQGPPELHTLYALVREELDDVEALLERELTSKDPFLNRLMKHGFRLGGKRLRPALVLLSGKACGSLSREHIVLAVAVELIHTATLIHDDVLDEATLRRHLDTVNARWDNETSVLLGDYLFTRAIGLASSLESTFACRMISEAGGVMCEGELRQIDSRGNYDLNEEAYLRIIADKTAALCSCCCRLGAHYAGADAEQSDAYARFGLSLGIAFQIVDDLLDVLGDEATTGKSLGSDLNKQKPTLPLIRLLDQIDGAVRDDLVELLSDPNDGHHSTLRSWLDRHNALVYSRNKACEFAKRAIDELAPVPATPAGETLQRLVHFVINRHQ